MKKILTLSGNSVKIVASKRINMNEIWTIWVDSDGVVADFESFISQINRQPFNQISKGRMWRSVEEYDRDVGPFFEALPKMADADELLDFVMANFINYGILTASGYVPKGGAQQKRNWYKRLYGNIIVKVVAKSADKAEFANPRSVLIDDRTKSITPWEMAGGVGILHKNAADTIRQLKILIATPIEDSNDEIDATAV
jgi:hypothetical protein